MPGLLAGVLILSLAVSIVPAPVRAADQNVRVIWINDNDENCHTADPTSPKTLTWTAQITNNGPGSMYIDVGAFHSPKSGCAATGENYSTTAFQMTGEKYFNDGETGITSFSFNTGIYQCGRVQVDAGYYDVNEPNVVTTFLGEMIDYGVDCSVGIPEQPQTQPCVENAVLTAPTIVPASVSAGSTHQFQINALNTGATKWYHGSYFQLVQTSGQNINPGYGHLASVMVPNDDQTFDFQLTAPASAGTYTLTLQMVHRAYADYMLPSGQVCGTKPTQDVYFGNQVSMTFTVTGTAVATGSIVVSSNIPTSWAVLGAQNFSGSGMQAVYTSAPAGSYTISHVPTSLAHNSQNYTLDPISPATQTLAAGQTIEFAIHYTPAGTTPTGNNGLNRPEIVSISNQACGQLRLVWRDLSDNEDGFKIYRSESFNSGDYTQYQQIATTAANATSYVDRPALNKSYYYIVVAYTADPARVSASDAKLSDFNTECISNLSASMNIKAINGQAYTSNTRIEDGDAITFQILIDNYGPEPAYITHIVDTVGQNLTQVRNLRASGPNAVVGSPAITGSGPAYNLNVHGRKDAGGDRWAVEFEATVALASQESMGQVGNCAVIHYFDEQSSKTYRVCTSQLLSGSIGGGAVQFREVAP